MTLRKVFTVVAVCAVVCAALKFPDVWAPILFSVAFLLVVGMAIIALVDRGSRQAYAIGFALAAISYAATLVVTQAVFGGREHDMYSCRLPTTRLLILPYNLIIQRTWTDATGKEIPNYVPSPASGAGGNMTPMVFLKQSPDPVVFAAAGHILWTLLFGYLGGHFARLVYARRSAGDRAARG